MSAVAKQRSEQKSSVFIVDDHALVRAGLSTIIDSTADLQVCGEATSVNEAVRSVQELAPDIAVVDLTLRQSDGLDLVKQLRRRFPQMKILVSSMHDEILYAERVLRAGGMGYIEKSESSDTLLTAIRHVLSGRVYLSPAMEDRLLLGIVDRNSDQTDPVDQLTDRELQVLSLIGDGKAIRTIALELKLSPKTIESHRTRIRNKLNLDSAEELSQFAAEWVRKTKAT